jgi:hypothetical protein
MITREEDSLPTECPTSPGTRRSGMCELKLPWLQTMEVTSGRDSEKAAMELHERMTETKMRLLGDRVSRRTAWQMAREHRWPTVHVAEYVAGQVQPGGVRRHRTNS